MSLTVKKLKFFLEVSKAQNFTKAAQKLCVSQPALTIAVSDLENTLGTKLFLRSRRAITLSDAGRKLYDRATKLLDDLDVLVEDVRKDGDSKNCSFGVTSCCFLSVFSDLYEVYTQSNYQNIDCRQIDFSDMPYAVLDEQVDVGISPKCFHIDGLEHLELWQETIGVAIPKDHAQGDRSDPLGWSDLSGMQIIAPQNPCFLAEEISRHALFSKMKGCSYLGAPNVQCSVDMARQLNKPAFLPSSIFLGRLTDDFVFRPLLHPKIIKRVYAITKTDGQNYASSATITQSLKKKFSSRKFLL